MIKSHFLLDLLLQNIDVVVGMYAYCERNRAAVESTPKCTSGHAINQVWWKYDVAGTFKRKLLGKMKSCIGLELAHSYKRLDGRSLDSSLVAMSSQRDHVHIRRT